MNGFMTSIAVPLPVAPVVKVCVCVDGSSETACECVPPDGIVTTWVWPPALPVFAAADDNLKTKVAVAPTLMAPSVAVFPAIVPDPAPVVPVWVWDGRLPERSVLLLPPPG